MAEYIPTQQLRPYIKAYKIIESRYGTINKVLPNTSLAIAFCFKGQISYLNDTTTTALPFATLSGLQKSVRLINYDVDSSAIIVIFKETGLSAFFKQPLHELFGKSVSLDNLFSTTEISLIQEQLSEMKYNTERIMVLEQFLLSKAKYFNTDKIILAAISRINALDGKVRIKELAKELCISQDAFEKRFRKITGATPKKFSHIVKMNAVISQYKTVPSFLDLAFENGYCDQSHFYKDFKIFTGESPTDFFRSAFYW